MLIKVDSEGPDQGLETGAGERIEGGGGEGPKHSQIPTWGDNNNKARLGWCCQEMEDGKNVASYYGYTLCIDELSSEFLMPSAGN